ncbi:MAG TPA: alpha-N-acetylglucosaminidase TIM-barrel domain-containing protein, partial [Rhodanobacteraceae bacterium]
PAPGHQPWFLLGNLTGFDAAALTPALYARRVALAQKIVARLRALGMTPVLPGYFGLVPPRFAATHPGAHVVAQGLWNGFRRPDWLDPRSPEFARIASTFYREQRALLGVTSLYRMSLMQEGGRFGDVPPGAAAHAVMAALQRAHPGAVWVMLGWGKNPEPAVLASVDRKHLFILDGVLKDWRDVDYAFGTIPNMGGQRTLGAPAAMWLQRFRKWLHEPGSRLRGIAWLPEASGIDPAAFDLFADLAWTPVPHAAGTCAARQSR